MLTRVARALFLPRDGTMAGRNHTTLNNKPTCTSRSVAWITRVARERIYSLAGERGGGRGHLWRAIIRHSLHMAVIREVHSRFCTPRAIRSGLLHRLLGGWRKPQERKDSVGWQPEEVEV